MNYLHSIIVNAVKQRYTLRKYLTGRFGHGERKNRSVPGDVKIG